MCGVCGALERESASSSVQAATFVKLSGDACIHTHEGQLLALNIVILLHFLFFISLILHSIPFHSRATDINYKLTGPKDFPSKLAI